jgi:hypothetical protein
MGQPITLPRLQLTARESYIGLDGQLELVDEAVITIDGHEEETITIECPNAHLLAERLVRLVNHHQEIVGALQAAANVLRGIEGTPAATIIAGACDLLLEQTGAAA